MSLYVFAAIQPCTSVHWREEVEYEFAMAEIASETTEEYAGLADGVAASAPAEPMLVMRVVERAAAVVVMDLRELEGIIILEVVLSLIEELVLLVGAALESVVFGTGKVLITGFPDARPVNTESTGTGTTKTEEYTTTTERADWTVIAMASDSGEAVTMVEVAVDCIVGSCHST
jgi:hypothetical protein